LPVVSEADDMPLRIKDSVLNAIADDDENIETILETLQKFDSTATTADQVSDVLNELVKDGLARAYELSPWPPHEKLVDFDMGRIRELWFYVTPKGKDLVRSLNSNS
jgi:hypothetical protein